MTLTPGMNLLLVEDCSADAKLVQLWLRDSATINAIHTETHGWRALEYVRGEGEFAGQRRPDLVLLDSNLPDMDANEWLEELRRGPSPGEMGVLVLSGSFNDADARRAHDLGAIGYLAKPCDADDYAALVQRIELFAARRVNG